ncbi:MAG: hypothetical protein AAF456_23740 [Planctomycetota bacterium]
MRWFLLITLFIFSTAPTVLCAQADVLVNGNFEAVEEDLPDGWEFNSQSGGRIYIDQEDAVSGDRSVLVDATESSDENDRLFANLSQLLDGKPFQGKRMRFRASVKTADMAPDATANLWFRVDRETADDSYLVGAFDNMQDRPIRLTEWDEYEIVLDVDDDAEQIIVGMFVIGTGKAWIDRVSFEEVGDEVATTGQSLDPESDTGDDDSDSSDDEDESPSRFQMDPLVMEAFANADKAPQQPFFTHWLWLVALTVLLFGLSAVPTRLGDDSNTQGNSSRTSLVAGIVTRFAFRFSFCYWIIYSFPVLTGTLLTPLIPEQWATFQTWYSERKDLLVHWAAERFFSIEGKMVPANGSGDTTSEYVTLFVGFLLALILAAVWSIVHDLIRKTEHRYLKDVLRSYLRYVLAFWMLSYGLGKVALVFNQFPTVSEYQFNKNWGDSSPMNVVWAFMGSSKAYTIFAGLGETAGALLLVWRRTAIIGALVTLGVMVNVVMLNYCYDVPVKLFSTHLMFMAIFILLPDAGRLLNVMLFNRSTEPVDLKPPYTNRWSIWIQRALKLTVIGWMIVWPCWEHYKVQAEFVQKQNSAPEYFGTYEVLEYKLNGETVEGKAWSWKSVRFLVGGDFSMDGEHKMVNKVLVGMEEQVGQYSANFNDPDGSGSLSIDSHMNSAMLQGEATFRQLENLESEDGDEQTEGNTQLWMLTGKTAAGDIEVTLKPNENIYRLTGRGFRWINEVPFNR